MHTCKCVHDMHMHMHMPQRKLVAGAAVPAAMRLPAPVLSTAFAALEQVRVEL